MSDVRPSFLPPEGSAAPAGGRPSFLPTDDAPVAEEKPEPGLLEAGLRGVKQGLTFGFGDEITGALESAFSSKTYRQARDEARAADKAAHDAHQVGYGIGEVLGGIAVPIPGTGALSAVKGAGLATRFAVNAAKGAGAGILSGAGNSEKGDIAGVVQDAASSGLAGAALGGILGTAAEKYVKGAAVRDDANLVNDLGNRALKSTRDKMAGKGDAIVEAAREAGLDKLARKAPALAEASDTARKGIGERIGSFWEGIDAKGPGVPLSKLEKPIQKMADELKKNPNLKGSARALEQKLADMRESWGQVASEVETTMAGKVGVAGKAAGEAIVPASAVHEFATAIGAEGFGGVSPKASKALERRVWGATNDVLKAHVREVAPEMSGELARLNRHYGALKDINAAASYRAKLESYSPTGLRQIAGHGINAMALIGAAASGSVLPLAAAAALPAGKAAHRLATTALAKLARAAQSGGETARLAQEALSAGVPRGLVEGFAPGIAALARPSALTDDAP